MGILDYLFHPKAEASSNSSGDIEECCRQQIHTDGMSELRKRPETLQLFRDVGLPAYWDLYGWPPMCRRVDAHDFDCD